MVRSVGRPIARDSGRSRATILAALRTGAAPSDQSGEAPPIEGNWLRSPHPVARRQMFAQMLEAAGGRCVEVAGAGELPAALRSTPAFASAERRVSLVPNAGDPTVDFATISRPHDLADVDFALLPGVFGVAENGSVWIDGEALPQRSVLVLPEHLGLVVAADALVDHMHAAYERLSFSGPGFGCFVSGPSKTADIEQALVIGAHGARSLCVYLVERTER